MGKDIKDFVTTDMCSAIRKGFKKHEYIISCESPDSGGAQGTGVEILTKESKVIIKYECRFCSKEHRIIINLE